MLAALADARKGSKFGVEPARQPESNFRFRWYRIPRIKVEPVPSAKLNGGVAATHGGQAGAEKPRITFGKADYRKQRGGRFPPQPSPISASRRKR
jgi:hypothetical protein